MIPSTAFTFAVPWRPYAASNLSAHSAALPLGRRPARSAPPSSHSEQQQVADQRLATGCKRGWSVTFALESGGHQHAKATSKHDEEHGDLQPPSKKRRGLATTLLDATVSAAVLGTAVGFAAWRIWRGEELEDLKDDEKVEEHRTEGHEPAVCGRALGVASLPLTGSLDDGPLPAYHVEQEFHGRFTQVARIPSLNTRLVQLEQRTARMLEEVHTALTHASPGLDPASAREHDGRSAVGGVASLSMWGVSASRSMSSLPAVSQQSPSNWPQNTDGWSSTSPTPAGDVFAPLPPSSFGSRIPRAAARMQTSYSLPLLSLAAGLSPGPRANRGTRREDGRLAELRARVEQRYGLPP